jgi:hypothetical protein
MPLFEERRNSKYGFPTLLAFPIVAHLKTHGPPWAWNGFGPLHSGMATVDLVTRVHQINWGRCAKLLKSGRGEVAERLNAAVC